MKRLFIGLWTLNLIDAVSTAFLVSWGFASEANPLLAIFVLHNPILFFTVKMLVITICLSILWVLRDHRWVKNAAIAVTLLYSALFAWHAYLWAHAAFHMNTAQCIEVVQYELDS